MIEKNNKFKK